MKFEPESLDCVVLLFALSAIDPKNMNNVVFNIHKYLVSEFRKQNVFGKASFNSQNFLR